MENPAPQPQKTRQKLTVVSSLHYFRLVYRAALFLSALVIYIVFRVRTAAQVESFIAQRPVILTVLWVIFMVEMVMRFIPSRFESPGSQKQFAGNYIKTGQTNIEVQDNIALVAAVGRKMSSRLGTSGEIFNALGSHGVNIRTIAQGADELSIIIGVDNRNFETAIRVLYDGFAG